MEKLISIELNELNFDLVRKYCALGKLPTFQRLIDAHGIVNTISEKSYPELEPWIQWPTVYSGKTFAEHGVFRLGDITAADHNQIWELLEQEGISVGAISPMNAANRCVDPDFFIPDPWTVTEIGGDATLKKLYGVVRDIVNANAHDQRSAARIGRSLFPFIVKYASPSSATEYGRILRTALRYRWARAVFLDRFLADIFFRLRKRHDTGFASLFLNAGAHIQHHYMFDSSVHYGEGRNPLWYSDHRQKGIDPLLFVYTAYDRILRDSLKCSNTRLLITTGLSQYANPHCIYQYRFKDYKTALAKFNVENYNVIPRMSRDFLLEFESPAAAAAAEKNLSEARCEGAPLFTIENKGDSLFCQIGYFGGADGFHHIDHEGRTLDLSEDVTLVSIENGIHRATGFHIDTAASAPVSEEPEAMPLANIFSKTRSHFDAGERNSAPSEPGVASKVRSA